MCGIVGYIGKRDAQPVLISGLKRLEYRGYDSAGIALFDGNVLHVRKRQGKLDVLHEDLKRNQLPAATLGVGHTRWATHGSPSDLNAHPHTDEQKNVAVVHNGIIENFRSLRTELQQKGCTFVSDTDTEVIPHLIEREYAATKDLVEAVRRATRKLKGAFALCVLSRLEPDKLVVVKQASPLVLGLGEGEYFVASDIPALLDHTRRVIVMDEGEMAVLTLDGIQMSRLDGLPVAKEPIEVNWQADMAEKNGYPHFMLKEIHEQPDALRNTMMGRLSRENGIDLSEMKLSEERIRQFKQIHLVACGTAYHAGLVGRQLLEKLVRIPAMAEVASEYRYGDPLVDEETLLVLISQSGETADTLAALREGKARGATTLAVTNVISSSIAREADHVLYTMAGPEIAVASTKAYTTQLLTLTLLALYLAQVRGTLGSGEIESLADALLELPEKAKQALVLEEEVKQLAAQVARWQHAFFIGRGLDYAVALEGQLKLKEISYIHAEAYAAGELKHGTLALIEEGVPVICLASQPELMDKMISNVAEVKARGAFVLGVGVQGEEDLREHSAHFLAVPEVHPWLAPMLTAVPLQLLAYYAAVELGADVDQPRNLAKSVTVE